jgi:hypothetical protein
VRDEIIDLYTQQINTVKDINFKKFLMTERERLIHQYNVDRGTYGTYAPKMVKYTSEMSLQMRVNLMKKFMTFLSFHYNTNTDLSDDTLLWIDNKIKGLYTKVGKSIEIINERKEYYNNKN